MSLSVLRVLRDPFWGKKDFLTYSLLVSGFLLFQIFFPAQPVRALTMEEVAREIMSPACPGQLLIDCPSGEGGQLRELIRQKIAQGETKEQIIQYFVDVYGENILAAPPKKGFFLTLWYLPYLILLNGIGVIALISLIWVRRKKSSTSLPVHPSSSTEETKYLDRVEKELNEFKY
ncbi:MAG TPA: cytochrome c-type biogenesis protein CcmH [Candidatus Limnocylindrales bacterium]|nr:cytochrome c-type biogenesis protein CcmH [Candidatus Limnocylindrales bacterium]